MMILFDALPLLPVFSHTSPFLFPITSQLGSFFEDNTNEEEEEQKGATNDEQDWIEDHDDAD